jgi:hypothetical protein
MPAIARAYLLRLMILLIHRIAILSSSKFQITFFSCDTVALGFYTSNNFTVYCVLSPRLHYLVNYTCHKSQQLHLEKSIILWYLLHRILIVFYHPQAALWGVTKSKAPIDFPVCGITGHSHSNSNSHTNSQAATVTWLIDEAAATSLRHQTSEQTKHAGVVIHDRE